MSIKLYCKICGKELKPCVSCYGKVFNWKNIACCISHFNEYIKLEEERRKSE
jgi:hypothetical protein